MFSRHSAMSWLSCTVLILWIIYLGHYAFSKAEGKEKKQKLKILSIPPLKEGENVVFWRPQKVGSSTLLSILMSYAYRYQFIPKPRANSNSFCRRISKYALKNTNHFNLSDSDFDFLTHYADMRIPGMGVVEGSFPLGNIQSKIDPNIQAREKKTFQFPFKIVLSHELCNLNAHILEKSLKFSYNFGQLSHSDFKRIEVKELFMVRDPVARALSIYYFWGELFKLKHMRKHNHYLQLGSTRATDSFNGTFTYHGDENTAPTLSVALKFANRLPYKRGMPGPSFTWTAFADNPTDAVNVIQSDRMMSLVLERLDESLVVAKNYLNWSLADMIVVQPRKALSSHPKVSAWPPEAIKIIKGTLVSNQEYLVYDTVNRKLDDRIKDLEMNGVDVKADVNLLRSLKKRSTELCSDEKYLKFYKANIQKNGIPRHFSNKLRDVEQKYYENGHLFSYNGEILGSFDVCGACEAQALLLSLKKWREEGSNQDFLFSNAPSLSDLPRSLTEGKIEFKMCPTF